jgi:hypothetical protein
MTKMAEKECDGPTEDNEGNRPRCFAKHINTLSFRLYDIPNFTGKVKTRMYVKKLEHLMMQFLQKGPQHNYTFKDFTWGNGKNPDGYSGKYMEISVSFKSEKKEHRKECWFDNQDFN